MLFSEDLVMNCGVMLYRILSVLRDELCRHSVINAAKMSMSSKIIPPYVEMFTLGYSSNVNARNTWSQLGRFTTDLIERRFWILTANSFWIEKKQEEIMTMAWERGKESLRETLGEGGESIYWWKGRRGHWVDQLREGEGVDVVWTLFRVLHGDSLSSPNLCHCLLLLPSIWACRDYLAILIENRWSS